MAENCDINSVANSPFLKKITSAIDRFGDKAEVIWVSIAKEAEEFTPKGEDKSILVKWLTWSLVDSEGNELLDPPLLVVHPELTENKIIYDLSQYFPSLKIEVDNEIYFED